MPKLEMEKYRTFSNMGKTCETRAVCEKKVIWPFYEKDFSGGKFKGRIMGRSDVDEVAELWRMSYPEVYGSSFGFILLPEEYEKKVLLKETYEGDSINKIYACYVVEEIETGTITGASFFVKDDKNSHVEFSLGAVHPAYRKKGMAALQGYFYALKLLEQTGAEYLTTFAETWHSIAQKIFLDNGWNVAGIFPGQFPRWIGGQEECRGCVVWFYKFLGEGEKYATKPEEWKLKPEIKKLWGVLEEINKG